jgi:hypothetical protein
MLKIGDRVAESSNTYGTGPYGLTGATPGNQTFLGSIGDTNTTYYCAVSPATGQWEIGLGTVSAGTPNTLSRDIVYDGSSGLGVTVNFSGGAPPLEIFCTIPSNKVLFAAAIDGGWNVPDDLSVSGNAEIDGHLIVNGIEYVFPASQAANRYLMTDGSGNLSWSTILAQGIGNLADVTITAPGAGQILRFNGSIWINSTNGSALTALNATNITSGTLPDARLGSNIPRLDQTNAFTANQSMAVTWNSAGSEFTSWLLAITNTASLSTSKIFNALVNSVSVFSVDVTGVISGIGSGITALNASNLSTGTIPTGRLAGAYTGITGIGVLGTKLTTVASSNVSAGFNLPHGTAPGSPVNGDVWTTTTGLYFHINGTTIGPINGVATPIPVPAVSTWVVPTVVPAEGGITVFAAAIANSWTIGSVIAGFAAFPSPAIVSWTNPNPVGTMLGLPAAATSSWVTPTPTTT